MLARFKGPHAAAAGIRRVLGNGRKRIGGRWRRFFDEAYYRYLFGLRVPGAPSLTRKLAAWERREGRGDVPVPAEAWESQYGADRWAYLHGVQQLARYSVIAGYLRALKRGGCLLDVGCGEGILLERLGAGDYAKFVGIDLSQTAIERAQKRHRGAGVAFMQADARNFVPEDAFDAIVFNEVLYYFDDPLAVAQRYRAWLKGDGLFIASLYAGSDRARAIGRLLRTTYPCIDELEITSRARSWIIHVMAPSGGAGG